MEVFFKLVCIDESDPLEYLVLEDVNKKTLEDIHKFVKEHINEHPECKWILLPYYIKK